MPEAWRDHLAGMPLDAAHDPGGRVVVVSAHPDDEVLAVGGWLADQADRDLLFVTATDGEASHPGSPSVTPDELRVRRPRELVRALQQLGHLTPRVQRLELPDGCLAGRSRDLRQVLATLVEGADLVLAPYEADGHPDHDAVGQVALELCADGPTLWRYPVWTWAWTHPDSQPWLTSLRALETSAVARDRKRRAIAAFTSQVQPLSSDPVDQAVVEGALLNHASFAPEVVIV